MCSKPETSPRLSIIITTIIAALTVTTVAVSIWGLVSSLKDTDNVISDFWGIVDTGLYKVRIFINAYAFYSRELALDLLCAPDSWGLAKFCIMARGQDMTARVLVQVQNISSVGNTTLNDVNALQSDLTLGSATLAGPLHLFLYFASWMLHEAPFTSSTGSRFNLADRYRGFLPRNFDLQAGCTSMQFVVDSGAVKPAQSHEIVIATVSCIHGHREL